MVMVMMMVMHACMMVMHDGDDDGDACMHDDDGDGDDGGRCVPIPSSFVEMQINYFLQMEKKSRLLHLLPESSSQYPQDRHRHRHRHRGIIRI